MSFNTTLSIINHKNNMVKVYLPVKIISIMLVFGVYQKFGLDDMEVTDEVFESTASIVFD